jgi:hypothetical protein
MDQITGLVGKTGRRGGGRRASGTQGGLPGKAVNFVAGFMSGGDQPKRGRRGAGARRRGGGRRR